tara:strand:- start:29 stop:367 length:339 start_codon:yes stop_codon:yes gene_type:complete
MLVDISYTIPLDQLPDRIKELLQRDVAPIYNSQKIENNLADVLTALQEEPINSLRVLEGVQKIREDLAFADMRLKNIYSMMSGYQQVLLEQSNPLPPEQAIPEQEAKKDEEG